MALDTNMWGGRQPRPFMTRLVGLIATLVATISLIAIIIFLDVKLPDHAFLDTSNQTAATTGTSGLASLPKAPIATSTAGSGALDNLFRPARRDSSNVTRSISIRTMTKLARRRADESSGGTESTGPQTASTETPSGGEDDAAEKTITSWTTISLTTVENPPTSATILIGKTPSPTSTSTSTSVTRRPTVLPLVATSINPRTASFMCTFLPLGFSTLLASAVDTIHVQSALYEPVRQLRGAKGASGAVLHGNSWPLFPPKFAAIVGSLAAAAMSSQVCQADVDAACDAGNPGAQCGPAQLSSAKWATRGTMVVLGTTAAVLVYLVHLYQREPSNMAVDPGSIGGVAAVMGHPVVERDFLRIPAEVPGSDLERRIRDMVFILGTFPDAAGRQKFGIMPQPTALTFVGFDDQGKPLEGEHHDHRGLELERTDSDAPIIQSSYDEPPPTKGVAGWKLKSISADVLFAPVMAALGFVCISSLTHADTPQQIWRYETWETATGVRVVFLLVGTLLARYWHITFIDTQALAPYISLFKGTGLAEATILLRRRGSPLTALVQLLRHGHLTPAAAALAALLSQVLLVVFAGVPWRPGQLRSEYRSCATISMVILGYMMATLVFVVAWRVRLPHLPRKPNTIAAIMTYVAGARMNGDFRSLEREQVRSRDKEIAALKKRYRFGRKDEGKGPRYVIDQTDYGPV